MTLLGALSVTAYFALRRSRHLSTAATSAGILLVADAWFDVMTTPSGGRLESLVQAVVELPLASVCPGSAITCTQLAARRTRSDLAVSGMACGRIIAVLDYLRKATIRHGRETAARVWATERRASDSAGS
jgi:hypothetical protein